MSLLSKLDLRMFSVTLERKLDQINMKSRFIYLEMSRSLSSLLHLNYMRSGRVD